MSREQFSLDEWLKDQSRKVVTEVGEPVKIVFTEGMGNYPVLAVIYDGDTTDSEWFTANGFGYDEHSRLYFGGMVCTPFQERLVKFYNDRFTLPHDTDGVCSQHDLDELLEKASAELLAIAYEQFKKDMKLHKEGEGE